MSCFCIAAGTLTPNRGSTAYASEASPATPLPQTGYTEAVPATYQSASARPGTVTRLDYASEDYVRDSAPITKTAYVYTPYGYDAGDTEKRYDILYLMHGWGGHAGEYFEYANLKNMFDNLIETGDVEGQYHTYARSTADEDLKAARNHRAFGGFSLGSVTTWLEFCHDTDYIRYFLPMSGSSWYYGTYGDFQIQKNVDYIEQLVRDRDLDERGYFIYHAVGTNDAVKSQSLMMADEMLSRGETFPPEHYVFYLKDGGYHDFDAVQEYLYNALPLFFREKGVEPSFRGLWPASFPGGGRLLERRPASRSAAHLV